MANWTGWNIFEQSEKNISVGSIWQSNSKSFSNKFIQKTALIFCYLRCYQFHVFIKLCEKFHLHGENIIFLTSKLCEKIHLHGEIINLFSTSDRCENFHFHGENINFFSFRPMRKILISRRKYKLFQLQTNA